MTIKGGPVGYAPPPDYEDYEEGSGVRSSFDLEGASQERPLGDGLGEARERLASTESAGTPKVQSEEFEG